MDHPSILARIRHIEPEQWRNYGILVAAIVGYILLAYFAPHQTTQNSSSLKINQLQAILLVITIILPYLLSWTLAVYGLTVLGQYLRRNSTANDSLGLTLQAIYKGLGWLVFSVIATALLGNVKSYLPGATAALTIITNYLYIFPPLIGFWLMYRELGRLRAPQKSKQVKLRGDGVLKTGIVLMLVAAYVFLVFTNPNRQVALDAANPASYYLPDPLIALTMILPVFVTWWLGFSVAFMIGDIVPTVVRAELFKGLTRILYGIWAIIFTAILIQALLSLGNSRLQAIGVGAILALLYLFVLLQGFGYLYVVLGIRKLQSSSS